MLTIRGHRAVAARAFRRHIGPQRWRHLCNGVQIGTGLAITLALTLALAGT